MTDGVTAQNQPAYRVLADRISEQILAGEIRPGEQLPPEITLAERFGVHRSTVREGIRLLEETGMLRRKSQKRLVVSVPDGTHLADRTAQALIMRQITVRELYEANLAFDPVLARLAAASASSTQIARLHRNLRESRAAVDNQVKLSALDAEFHLLVCEATNNEIFQTMRQPLHDLFLPMVSDLVDTIDTSERMITAHERIVAAIEHRDGVEAEAWARRHIEDFKRFYLKAALDFDRPVAYGKPVQA
ncbi:FadR family transcriptional regulator [Pseudaminobacter arsenicus]|uniref:FadR family transcriptional regulator n=1 Tax=Borborobacter arsenicus TaxID=1851146 RepID=A0A432V7N9_9HYPH|nr:FCD domain-containing protein [Pseudaminobacter arsenicus]RUM98174.1 FadR family transcriptional regulator [Pseudaminobacter arsenicus]